MTLSYLEKKLIFRSCFHDLLELSLSLITPPLGRQDLPQNATHAHELWVFQSGWWEQALFLALHACLLDTLPQIEVISFHACEDRALLSTSGGAPAVLQTSQSRPYSPVLFPANFSYLSLPRLSAPCPQLGKSPRLCLGSMFLCSSPEILSKQ